MQTIPAYRMTDADVETDRARFRDLDVTWVKGTQGRGRLPGRSPSEGRRIPGGLRFDRYLRPTGPWASRARTSRGSLPALDFLKEINRGARRDGGTRRSSSSAEAMSPWTRSARRLRKSGGGHVTLVYRRGRQEMPADPEEVHGAEQEGIRFLFQKAPLRIVGTDRVEGLVVQSIELGPPEHGGRRSPVPVPGSEETLPCDTVIVAVGQKADLEGFGPDLDLKLTSQGWPEGKGKGFQTGVPGIFAAGGRSVVYAMGTATEAADAIDAYLSGLRGEPTGPRPDPFGKEGTFARPAGCTTPIRI